MGENDQLDALESSEGDKPDQDETVGADPKRMDRDNLDQWTESLTGLIPGRDDPEAIAAALHPFGDFGQGIRKRYDAIEAEEHKAVEAEERAQADEAAEAEQEALEAARSDEDRLREQAAQGVVDLRARLEDLRHTGDLAEYERKREEIFASTESVKALADVMADADVLPPAKLHAWEQADPVVRERATQMFGIRPPADIDIASDEYQAAVTAFRDQRLADEAWVARQVETTRRSR